MIKKVVILGAGLGTRLYPITYEIPKPLLPIQNKPILNHLIDFFGKYGEFEFGLIVLERHRNHFKKWLTAWGDELPHDRISLFYQKEPEGTFGELRLIKDWLGGESFFLSNGDDLKDFNLNKLLQKHEEHKPTATLALIEVQDPHNYGVPILENDFIKGFLEKPENPPLKFISAGLYVVDPIIFAHDDSEKKFIMLETDIFPKLAGEGRLVGVTFQDGRLFDCGTLERWERAIREW